MTGHFFLRRLTTLTPRPVTLTFFHTHNSVDKMSEEALVVHVERESGKRYILSSGIKVYLPDAPVPELSQPSIAAAAAGVPSTEKKAKKSKPAGEDTGKKRGRPLGGRGVAEGLYDDLCDWGLKKYPNGVPSKDNKNAYRAFKTEVFNVLDIILIPKKPTDEQLSSAYIHMNGLLFPHGEKVTADDSYSSHMSETLKKFVEDEDNADDIETYNNYSAQNRKVIRPS